MKTMHAPHSRAAEFIQSLICRPNKIGSRLARSVRRTLVANGWDPVLAFELNGMELAIHFSHELPYHLHQFPGYQGNLSRVAAAVARKYPQALFVDIGANVGDSAAFMRSHSSNRILAVEGGSAFLHLLSLNADALGDVRVVPFYVGGVAGPARVRIQSGHGTEAVEVVKEGGAPANFVTLGDVVRKNSAWGSPKLIKIDTDGYDNLIIQSSSEVLSEHSPVLFFEYDPYSQMRAGDREGWLIFDYLLEHEYRHLLLFRNTGDFLMELSTTGRAELRDLHGYFLRRKSSEYLDICAVPQKEDDVLEKLLATERRLSSESS